MQPAVINGSVGLVFAPNGKLSRALTFTFAKDRIVEVEIIADREQLQNLDLAILDQ
jgi:RNA polymerase sigma-70 factor (ECF subfamily)